MKIKKSKESDVTNAFIKTADDYILLADNIDEARNRAHMAVLAWNISLYPQEQIAEHIRIIALEYEKNNPGVVNPEHLAYDLQILVDKKIKNSLISNERLLKLACNKRMITMNSSLNQFLLCSNIKRERINLSKDKYYEDEWQNNILSEIN